MVDTDKTISDGADSGAAAKELIRRLAVSAIDENGKVKPFAEQLKDYAAGNLMGDDYLVVATDAARLNVPTAEHTPLLIKAGVIGKSRYYNEISMEAVAQFPGLIKNSPLAMESLLDDDSLVIVLDLFDKDGEDLLAVVRLGKRGDPLAFNEITSIKTAAEMVDAYEKGQRSAR
jgi:hypothetical protein